MRPVLGHHGRDDPLGGALLEERPGDLLDHPRLRALAEADRDGAVADDLDVPALERRRARSPRVEAVVVAHRRIPVVEPAAGEHRVGGGRSTAMLYGLAPAGGPVHRVDRDAAVDPARRVAREQRIRERRQDECRRVVDGRRDERSTLRRAHVEAGFLERQAADEMAGQDVRRHRRQASPARRRRGRCPRCTRWRRAR